MLRGRGQMGMYIVVGGICLLEYEVVCRLVLSILTMPSLMVPFLLSSMMILINLIG